MTNTRLATFTVFAMATLVSALWLLDAAITRPEFDHLGGMSDFVNIRLYIQKLEEPALYARDYLYASTDVARQYTPSYRHLISALSRLTGDMGNALVVLTAILAFVYMLTMTRFLRSFTARPLIAILLAAVSSVPHYSPGGEFWGTGGLYSALPRTVFASVTPLLLLTHLRFCSTVRGASLSLALVGLAANLHPITGALLAQVFLAERFIAALRRRFPFWGLISAAACFVLCALPFMLGFFGIMSKSHAPGAIVSPQAFYAAVWTRYSPMLLPPSRETVWSFAEAFFPLLPLAIWGMFAARQSRNERTRGILDLLGSLLLVVIGGQITLQCLARSTGWSLMLVDQLRGLRLIYPLAFALVASGLSNICNRLPRWLTAPTLVTAGLWLLPVLALPSLAVTRDHFPRALNYLYWSLTLRQDLVLRDIQNPQTKPRTVDIETAAKWARENTLPQSLFLCEDARFRLFSKRSAAYAFKDGGSCYYLGKGPFMEWARREAAVRSARQSGKPEAWIDLAKALGCDYVVIDKQATGNTSITGAIYDNGTFTIVPAGAFQSMIHGASVPSN